MDSEFKIYVDRLRDGKVEKIDLSFLPDFLDVIEQDLSFNTDVQVQGEVYIANDELVFHLDIGTKGVIPCSICNEPVEVGIYVKGLYHLESLQNVKAGIFDMKSLIRENVLLETPAFAECHQGNCPKRREFKKYLKNSSSEEPDVEPEGYQPFTNLTLEE